MALEVETLCEVYWRILSAGEPFVLNDSEMQEVLVKFNKGYGSSKAFLSKSKS